MQNHAKDHARHGKGYGMLSTLTTEASSKLCNMTSCSQGSSCMRSHGFAWHCTICIAVAFHSLTVRRKRLLLADYSCLVKINRIPHLAFRRLSTWRRLSPKTSSSRREGPRSPPWPPTLPFAPLIALLPAASEASAAAALVPSVAPVLRSGPRLPPEASVTASLA